MRRVETKESATPVQALRSADQAVSEHLCIASGMCHRAARSAFRRSDIFKKHPADNRPEITRSTARRMQAHMQVSGELQFAGERAGGMVEHEGGVDICLGQVCHALIYGAKSRPDHAFFG